MLSFWKMTTEFLWRTLLTLKEDEREALRGKFDEWLKCFLPKLKRESTRTAKCRLVASVERHEFGEETNTVNWRLFKFFGNKGIIFSKNEKQLEEFEATSFQKKVLRENPDLLNVFIGRSKIKEENGKWQLFDGLKDKIISEGGEAIVFSEKLGDREFAVRVQVFDPFLFTTMFAANQIKWKTHLISDFGTAIDNEKDDTSVVPIHKNVVQNFANFELYESGDEREEDCLGWITLMEKCDGDLQKELKKENLNFDERKKNATGIATGFKYLEKIGIYHRDRKLSNFLLIGGQVKICDFGLVQEYSGRRSYRQLGYARRGSKYKTEYALFSGTPGFTGQYQLGGRGAAKKDYILYLFCDWKTIWSLKYRPIDDNQQQEIDKIVQSCGVRDLKNENHVIASITKIISLQNASSSFCFDEPNLTKSLNLSNLKHQMTKCVNLTMQNLTKNILDQKSSNLCVPISVTALLRFAIKNDLDFVEKDYEGRFYYSSENILTTLTMVVYPRSFAGLNLNPKKEETEFQTNDVETLLRRICEKTYLMESGWEIIRRQGYQNPAVSTCKFKTVLLNENFLFTRPLTVTGAYILPDDTIFFHQMVLDRVDDLTDEYVLQNTSFKHGGAVLRIPKTREYYVNEDMMLNNNPAPGEFKFYGRNCEFMWLVNEDFGINETHRPMMKNTWYLLPQAYSLTLVPKQIVSQPDQHLPPSRQELPTSDLETDFVASESTVVQQEEKAKKGIIARIKNVFK